jgi:hypothetical protein
MGEKRNAYRVLVGELQGKRPLERPRRRWTENITTYCKAGEWEGVDWITVAQDGDKWRTVVDAVMNLRVP